MRNKILIIAFILMCLPTVAHSATYYVRTDGHDTNCNGTADAAAASAPNCAELTITAGIADASCGDTVIVGDGNYNEAVTISNACTAGNVLTVQAQNKWGAVMTASSPRQFYTTGSYIKLDGFKSTGFRSSGGADYYYSATELGGSYNTATNMYAEDTDGYAWWSTGSNNTISYNYAHEPGFGIWINGVSAGHTGTNCTVIGNEIDGLRTTMAEADYLRFFGNGHVIKSNYFHGADLATLAANGAHVDCFQTFTAGGTINSSNITIQNNWCENAHEGIMASAGTGSSDTLNVYNNIFKACTGWATVFTGITNVSYYNNTIIDSGQSACGYTAGEATSCTFKNNIFWTSPGEGGTPYSIREDGSWIESPTNNLLYRLGTTYSAATFPDDVLNDDPDFTGAADYTLQAGSPAIAAGANLSAIFTDDYNGVTRQASPTAWDIGAYRYGTDTTNWDIDLTVTGTGCSLSPADDQVVANGANSNEITAVVNTGYKATWSIDGAAAVAVANGGTYQFTNVTADHTIAITCAVQGRVGWRVP